MNNNIFKTGQQLLLLLGFFLVGLFVAQGLSQAIASVLGEATRDSLLIQAVFQNLFAFIIPAWGAFRIGNKYALSDLGLARGVTVWAIVGVVAMYLISLPMMNQLIYWNAGMHLPDSMKSTEEIWRKMEEMGAGVTSILTEGTSWWTLVSGILVIGVLTGIAEEMFFRGALQGIFLRSGMRTWMGVWLTAVIFSLMHFQMFGFVPRLLLGAWFGYLYVWTRSLWIPVAAHALNNSMVVLMTWLANRGVLADDFDSAGVTFEGVPWWAIRSAVLTGLLLISCRKWFLPKKSIANSRSDANLS